MAGHLVNLVLGALVLWVGQETVQQNAGIAAQHERVKTLEQRFDAFWRVLNERTSARYHGSEAHAADTELAQEFKELRTRLENLRTSHEVAVATHLLRIEAWQNRLAGADRSGFVPTVQMASKTLE